MGSVGGPQKLHPPPGFGGGPKQETARKMSSGVYKKGGLDVEGKGGVGVNIPFI